MHTVLRARGELADGFVISVPVSARAKTSSGQLGNQVGVIPVTVPTTGPSVRRLATIAGVTHAAPHPSGRRGSSAAVLGAAFRGLARIGLFGWFIAHQRLVNTFLTNIRGPREPLTVLGTRIDEIVAISPIAGNVTVAFAALSYAGTLTVTLVADPDACPELDGLAAALQRELDELVRTDPDESTVGS